MKVRGRRRRRPFDPELTRVERHGVGLEVDEGAQAMGVLVAFSGRRGGRSAPPFDSLNVALSVGDEAEAVIENRRRVARAAGFEPWALVLARQVHGTALVEVGRRGRVLVGEADGLVARHRGPVLGLLSADCAPVVVAGARGLAVAHAGWRGLVGGIVGRAVDAVGPVHAAWVGPSIRKCCYEVGPSVIEAFRSCGLPLADDRHVDIADSAAVALRSAGAERVVVSEACTHCDGRWFSHRRDGVTGRNGAFAALT